MIRSPSISVACVAWNNEAGKKTNSPGTGSQLNLDISISDIALPGTYIHKRKC